MNVDVSQMLDTAVTVFNRIPAKAAGWTADMYRPTTIQPACWSETLQRAGDSDGTVHANRSVRIQIPATSCEYLGESEWVARAVEGASEGSYTLSTHDYAAKGNLGLRNDLTRSEVLKAIEGVPHCEISQVRDLRNNGGALAPATGCLKYANVVYAEGN